MLSDFIILGENNGDKIMNKEGNWIQTYTGKQFYPLDPKIEDIDILDIAHALSMKCRFNGHCKDFYSVAQHSIYVAEECEKRYPNRKDLHLWGLLHDSGEAYLPDIPRPIKQMDIGILRKCEKNILKLIVEKYGLGFPEPEEIKKVDNIMLATESYQLMKKHSAKWNLFEKPINMIITSNTYTSTIEYLFLKKFKKLYLGENIENFKNLKKAEIINSSLNSISIKDHIIDHVSYFSLENLNKKVDKFLTNYMLENKLTLEDMKQNIKIISDVNDLYNSNVLLKEYWYYENDCILSTEIKINCIGENNEDTQSSN